eukprot:1153732-Amphidinium_carterae.2
MSHKGGCVVVTVEFAGWLIRVMSESMKWLVLVSCVLVRNGVVWLLAVSLLVVDTVLICGSTCGSACGSCAGGWAVLHSLCLHRELMPRCVLGLNSGRLCCGAVELVKVVRLVDVVEVEVWCREAELCADSHAGC